MLQLYRTVVYRLNMNMCIVQKTQNWKAQWNTSDRQCISRAENGSSELPMARFLSSQPQPKTIGRWEWPFFGGIHPCILLRCQTHNSTFNIYGCSLGAVINKWCFQPHLSLHPYTEWTIQKFLMIFAIINSSRVLCMCLYCNSKIYIYIYIPIYLHNIHI